MKLFFVAWLQTGFDPALHQGCVGDPEDLSYDGGQAAIFHDPTGHRHHPGIHQGDAGAPQIQTGQHLVSPSLQGTADQSSTFILGFHLFSCVNMFYPCLL